jgi:hypothetical protein
MFSELIYTRCRQGMDITKKGHQISSEGYKVYSCTHSIMEEGKVDIQYLVNAIQAKQPYTDPDFMDDAYLFYVPDSGESFFINFHPIHFDASVQGGYSHRPGNFVNHALLGDFSGIYPYKMFQDDVIWNAKTKGEAYYYETPPSDDGLPVRGDIIDPPGKYKYEEIGAFISDGRQEVLKKAVAFLIAQYNEEPEKRKYLIIKDDSSRNIELWISAIECAFSPKIASVIPFATRMDKFTNINRYTVKLGIYQPQMNLQDPNHKQRYRAMIIGLDERDKANVNMLRPLPNSPFVLLDGKQKQLAFECNVQNNYYKLIVKFDDEHNKFCGKFLQVFNIQEPSANIYELYDIFDMFNKPSLGNAQALSDILGKLSKYQGADSDIFRDIYNRVNTDVSRLLQEDFLGALNVINWLQSASKITGDTGVKQRLTETICDKFAGFIFNKNDNAKKRSYWTQIQRTEFAQNAAGIITNMEKIGNSSSNLNTPADITAFTSIYLEAISLTGGIIEQNIRKIVKYGAKVCCQYNDTNSLKDIDTALSRISNIDNKSFLLSLVKDEDKALCEFVIKYIIDRDAVVASDISVKSFCEKLKKDGLAQFASLVLIKRADKFNKPSEMELFIKTVLNMDFINKETLAKVFESVDNQIGASKDNISSLVELLQTQKPDGAKCLNSAHFLALNIFSGNFKKKNLIEVFKDLKNQGVPSFKDESYIDKLIENFIKANLTEEEQKFILDFLFHSPKEYYSAYMKNTVSAASKYKDKWNDLINFLSDGKNRQFFDDMVQALVDSKQNEKSLTTLGSLIKEENGLKYYTEVLNKALEIILSQKDKPGKGKLFGNIFG